MSDTPRTDAARRWYQTGDNQQYELPVALSDMAKLERELNSETEIKNKILEQLKKFGGHLPFCDEAMRSACKECICGWEKIKESLDNS